MFTINIVSSTSKGILTRNPFQTSNFKEFCNHLEKIASPVNTPKHQCLMVSFAEYTNTLRKTEFFKSTQILCYDIDNTNPLLFDDLVDLQSRNIEFLCYMTPSNRGYRVIFPLSTPCVNAAEYSTAYDITTKKLLPNIQIDPACKDAVHFFYVSNPQSFFYSEGTVQISLELPTPTTPTTPTPPPPTNIPISISLESKEITQEKLNYILAQTKSLTSTYQTWIEVGFALASLPNHGFTYEEAEDYFIQFSKFDGDKCLPTHALKNKFNELYTNNKNNYSIATLYFHAKNNGIVFPLKKTNIPCKLIKSLITNTCHLVKKHNESDDIVPVHYDSLAYDVAREKIVVFGDSEYAFDQDEIFYYEEDKKTGKPKFCYVDSISRWRAKYEIQPRHYQYILGASEIGIYFEKSTKTLISSLHQKKECYPIYSQQIVDFLKQLPIDYDWICSYLYYSLDREVALPILHQYGVSNSGKSLLALLISSLWTGNPITNYFTSKDFVQSAGQHPVIWFDEKIPPKPDEIKNLVTDYNQEVNQKFKGAQSVRGYPLIISSVNEDYLHFPSTSHEDEGAIRRRIQPMQYTKQNTEYLINIGGFTTIQKWLKNNVFAEHVAYIVQNPNLFNIVKKGTDIFALPPRETQEMKNGGFTFSTLQRGVTEHFFYKFGGVTEGDDKKELIVDPIKWGKSLVEDRVCGNLPTIKYLERTLRKSNLKIKRDSSRGITRWRINFEEFKEKREKFLEF